MKNKIIILAIMLTSIVYFSSCSKDDEVVKNTTKVNKIDKLIVQNQDDILMFSDQDDFANQIVLINQMNNDELISFEGSNSYTSYGLFCDNLYLDLAKDSLNPDLVIENTEVYSDYLQLIPDDDESGYITLSAPAVTFSKYTNNL